MQESCVKQLRRVRELILDFLETGLFDDDVLWARELRFLRTEITRAIVELEKAAAAPAPEGGAGVDGADRGGVAGPGAAGAPPAEVKP